MDSELVAYQQGIQATSSYRWWNKRPRVGRGCQVFAIMGKDNTWGPINISNFPAYAFADMWRPMDSDCDRSMFAYGSGFCHDGILHWSPYRHHSKTRHLIAFNGTHGKSECINCPEEEIKRRIDQILACQSGGHAAFYI